MTTRCTLLVRHGEVIQTVMGQSRSSEASCGRLAQLVRAQPSHVLRSERHADLGKSWPHPSAGDEVLRCREARLGDRCGVIRVAPVSTREGAGAGPIATESFDRGRSTRARCLSALDRLPIGRIPFEIGAERSWVTVHGLASPVVEARGQGIAAAERWSAG